MERAELARALAAAAPGLRPDLIASIKGDEDVFLLDPNWGPSDRKQFAALADVPKPGAAGVSVARQRPVGEPGGEGWLMLPSGGTSGKLKLARHDHTTLAAAAAGFAAHFSAREVCSVGVLPLHHVSGLMAWVRCGLTGGAYAHWDWKRLEAGVLPGAELPAAAAGRLRTVSLVPTQLHRLLALPAAVAWLRGLDAVFLGGGAPWPALLDTAAKQELPISVGYGMTETAAMACGQRPAEFLAGDRSAGRALPHIQIAVTKEGVARLAGKSVAKGSYPHFDPRQEFLTEDLVSVAADGRVSVLGRRDAVIITGGKKVDPAEVEAALRATGRFSDLAVIGTDDGEWGEVVTLCHPAADGAFTASQVAALLADLAGHKRPRRVVALADWPRTPQGKVNRKALRDAADAG